MGISISAIAGSPNKVRPIPKTPNRSDPIRVSTKISSSPIEAPDLLTIRSVKSAGMMGGEVYTGTALVAEITSWPRVVSTDWAANGGTRANANSPPTEANQPTSRNAVGKQPTVGRADAVAFP